jgi:membrane associated rhomboid family serine protease
LEGVFLLNWIGKLERKYKRFAIRDLVKYLVIGSAVVFALKLFNLSEQIDGNLTLSVPDVLEGQVWRLITFIFIPPTYNAIFIIFALLLTYMFGKALEDYWGSFRLNLYYAIGMLSAILAAFITGYGHAEFLNLSIFLAFAYLNPNFKILVFFILPLKIKYLAWFDIALIVYSVIFSPFSVKVAAVISFMNFFVFFGRDMYDKWVGPRIKKYIRKRKRSKFKVIVPDRSFEFVHKCRECGRTSKEYNELNFGYCQLCGSDYEYCHEHLKNHKHFLN